MTGDGKRGLIVLDDIPVSGAEPAVIDDEATGEDPSGEDGCSYLAASLTDMAVRRTARPTERAPSRKEQGRNIASYWGDLRRSRQWPAASDLDPKQMAFYWPNSMIIGANPESRTLQVEKLFAPTGSGGAEGTGGGPIDGLSDTDVLHSLVTEWVLEIIRDVARDGNPLEEIVEFPGRGGPVCYRVVALPLGGSPARVESVLCYLDRTT